MMAQRTIHRIIPRKNSHMHDLSRMGGKGENIASSLKLSYNHLRFIIYVAWRMYHDVLSVKNSNWSIGLKNTSWNGFGYQNHQFRQNKSPLVTSGVNKSIFVIPRCIFKVNGAIKGQWTPLRVLSWGLFTNNYESSYVETTADT